jgi:hypothetical protein
MDTLAKRKLALVEILLALKDEGIILSLERLLLPEHGLPDHSSQLLADRPGEYRRTEIKPPQEDALSIMEKRKNWVEEFYGSARFTDDELAGDERLRELVKGARTKSTYRADPLGRK